MSSTPDLTSDADLARLLEEAKGSSRKRRFALLGGAAVLLLVLVAGTLLLRGGPALPRFQTQELVRGNLEVTITATGNLEGLNTVEVGAEVSGRAVEVLVTENDRVEKGQLLARIDPQEYEAAVAEAQARVTAADAAVLQAQATFEEAEAQKARGEAQDAEGLIARKELDTLRATALRAKAALASARAEAQLARANLASARTRLGKTEIRAPIGGVVLARSVELGQTVTAGFQTPVLFKLGEDLTRMRLNAAVDESDVGKVKAGQKARFTVDAWPDRVFEAEVTSVLYEPTFEGTVVTYETLLSVDNSELLLRPGMTATATIIVDSRKDVLLVPNAALRFSPPQPKQSGGFAMPGMGPPPGLRRGPTTSQGPRVWILDGPMPRPVPVQRLATDGIHTQVEGEGLQPGMKVIVDLLPEEK